MVTGAGIHLADGRTRHAYDTSADRIASDPGASGPPIAHGEWLAARVRA